MIFRLFRCNRDY